MKDAWQYALNKFFSRKEEQDLEVKSHLLQLRYKKKPEEYGQWRSVNMQVIITLIWTTSLTHMESSPTYDTGSNIKESVVPTSKHTMRGPERHPIQPWCDKNF